MNKAEKILRALPYSFNERGQFESLINAMEEYASYKIVEDWFNDSTLLLSKIISETVDLCCEKASILEDENYITSERLDCENTIDLNSIKQVKEIIFNRYNLNYIPQHMIYKHLEYYFSKTSKTKPTLNNHL